MPAKGSGSSTRRIDPYRMKAMNTTALLNLVRDCGPLSRSDLARLSRLSKPTVSEQIADLLARGLVNEIGQRESGPRRGKKATLLQFNEDAGRVVAARISTSMVEAWEARLDGSVINKIALPIQSGFGPDLVIRILKDAIRSMLAGGAEVPLHRRLISVAAPGLVDIQNGIVLETDNVFGWRDVPLGSLLHWEFGIPVVVNNDVNLAVLAEAQYGGDREEQSFALIQLDTGIGLGVFLNGALHHGRHWAAGEIAHMVPYPAKIGLPTAGRGHLESLLAEDRVTEHIRELALTDGGLLAQYLENKSPIAALVDAADDGDAAAADYVRELVEILGAAIANVSACYDPDKIILLGSLFTALFDRIRSAFESVIRWPVKLELSNVGEDVFLHGALVAGLERIFDRLEIELETVAPNPAPQPSADRAVEPAVR